MYNNRLYIIEKLLTEAQELCPFWLSFINKKEAIYYYSKIQTLQV